MRTRLTLARQRCLAGIALAAALLVPIMTPPATADSHYSLKEVTVASPLAQPCNVESAPDGSLWFIEHATRRLGRINVDTGAIRKFNLPPTLIVPVLGSDITLPGVFPIGPCDMTIPGDGNLWYNDQYRNTIGYISLSPPYTMHEVSLLTPASVPMSLNTGADGNIYVTETASNKIAKIDVDTHAVTEFDVPTPESGIIGGTPGQDGAHWFVEIAGNKILRFDYATHAMREYTVPTPGALPFVIRSYDGQIYFTESGANAVGHLDPSTGTFTEATMPTPASLPIGVTKGKDGFLYTDEAVGNKIARIDPSTMTVVAEYPLPTPVTFVDEIKMGPDGAIWAPEFLTGKIARLWLPSFGKDPGFPRNGGSVTGATNLLSDTLRLAHL